MKVASDIKPVSYLKSHAADILREINETHRPMVITQNGKPKAVMQDPASYDSMCNAIGLLKLISQGEEDIRQGRAREQAVVFKDIESFLAVTGR